jgi:hypothetical protein
MACILPAAAWAEEGAWLYTAAPKDRIKAKYAINITDPWLDHLRLSSVSLANGSGAFVSADGLVLTTEHLATSCLRDLSTASHDYLKDGFYAKKRVEELRCPGLELSLLQQMTDVTTQANAGVKPGMPDADAAKLQQANIAPIVKQCAQDKNIRCEVTALYSGALFYLYQYKIYNDVRLVFAPEFEAAAFGGTADQFEFPRYGFDVAFLRAYEDGKPVQPAEYLTWAGESVQEGDFVFISGSPRNSRRGETVNQVYFLYTHFYPVELKDLARRLQLLKDFAAQSPENARAAADDIAALETTLKATTGFNTAFTDQNLIRQKIMDERIRLIRSQNSPLGRREFVAYRLVDDALRVRYETLLPYLFWEQRYGFRGRLAAFARTLVRAAEEKSKPDDQRLEEYRDSALPALEEGLFPAAPISKSLETVVLADSLKEMQARLGADNAVVVKVLHGKPPDEVAKDAIAHTQLDDAALRRQLYQGGADAIERSADPLIVMMRDIEPEVRALRKRYDSVVDAPIRENDAVIAKSKFQLTRLYLPPDANFSPRFSYGHVKGYVEDGRGNLPKDAKIPAFTTFDGAFHHADEHGNQAPYHLPDRWTARQKKIRSKTTLNFVSTADTVGGNPGTPVVNKDGQLVGLVFDGNFQSLTWPFRYDEAMGRAVSADAQGILEALRKIYNADDLVKELTRRPKAKK